MAFPDVSGESDEHHWMEEGMATYIEPIARAEIGRMSPERVWGDFVRHMPQGLPQAGDQGLDHTSTWGHLLGRRDNLASWGTLKFARLRTTRKGCGMQCAAFCGARGASGRLGDGDDGDRGFVLADEGDSGAYRSGRSVAAHGCAGESRSGNVRRSRAVS
jgi:hypothetical protein